MQAGLRGPNCTEYATSSPQRSALVVRSSAVTPSRYVAGAGASIEEKVAPGSRSAPVAASAPSAHVGVAFKSEQFSQARPRPGLSP